MYYAKMVLMVFVAVFLLSCGDTVLHAQTDTRGQADDPYMGEILVESDANIKAARDGSMKKIPYSKEDMLRVIRLRLKAFPEIVGMISELQMRRFTDGTPEYFYSDFEEGMVKKLEDLDVGILYELFIKINNEASRIQTERLMRQIQQQQQLQRQQQQLQQQQQQQQQQQAQVQQQAAQIGAIQQQAQLQQQIRMQTQMQGGAPQGAAGPPAGASGPPAGAGGPPAGAGGPQR